MFFKFTLLSKFPPIRANKEYALYLVGVRFPSWMIIILNDCSLFGWEVGKRMLVDNIRKIDNTGLSSRYIVYYFVIDIFSYVINYHAPKSALSKCLALVKLP